MNMKKILNDAMTDADNETFDNARVLCFLSFLIYFSMGIGSMFTGDPWGPMDFAGGVTAMAVGFGVNFHLNRAKDDSTK